MTPQTQNKKTHPWVDNLVLVEDEAVMQDNYIVTNAKGRVLSGGDIKQGLQWRAKGALYHGPGTHVHARPDVVRHLLKDAKQQDKKELLDANGNRLSS